MFSGFFAPNKERKNEEVKINVPLDSFMDTVNAQNQVGKTTLHKAIEKDNLAAVRNLLKDKDKDKVDINIPDDDGNTPLHAAARKKKDDALDYVTLLMANDASVNALNGLGESPLHLAVQARMFETVKYLLLHFARVDQATHYSKQTSISNFSSIARDVIPGYSTPFHYAFYVNKLSEEIISTIITTLITYKMSLDARNENGATAFHLALTHPDINSLSPEIINILLEHTNLKLKTDRQQTCLHLMIKNKNIDISIFKQILGSKFFINAININDIDKNNETALFSAISNKSCEKATILLKIFKANPILGDGKTYPLHLAAKYNLTDLTRELIEYSNVMIKDTSSGNMQHFYNVKDSQGKTPLIYAVENANEEVIDQLKKHGADFSGPLGQLALKKALLNNDIKLVIKLISYGANPDFHIYPGLNYSGKLTGISFNTGKNDGVDKTGYLKAGDTLAHYAVRTENKELLIACLKVKPEMVNASNERGKMPSHIAIKMLSPEMANILKKNGVKLKLFKECSKQIPLSKEKRKNTLFAQAISRQFSDDLQLKEFFENPEYKLTKKQEEAKEKALKKYQSQRQNVDGKMFSPKPRVTQFNDESSEIDNELNIRIPKISMNAREPF